MENALLQVPAELSKATTMAHRSLRIVFDSQENLTDEQMAKIMALHSKIGWLAFLPEDRKIDALDIVSLPQITWEKDEKSPGQRLRAALFIYWQQNKHTKTFSTFYEQQMEKYINNIKEKLV